MIEMIRSKEVADLEIIELLKNADSKEFTPYGEGIPDWQTFIDFYRNHSEKVKNAILNGYTITFLTKNALKTLLNIKFNLEEGIDYQVFEYYFDGLILSPAQLEDLQNIISMNWKVIKKDTRDQKQYLRIELNYEH
jgi:hypothetical protein